MSFHLHMARRREAEIKRERQAAAIRIEAGTGGTVKHGPTRSARAGAEGIAPTQP